MPDRSFNLDELLGEKYVRHYLRFIQGAGNQFAVNTAPVWEADEPPSRDWDAAWVKPGTPSESGLVRVGAGPDSCSSSGELRVVPEVVWDVCGYYRRLGVRWDATRVQLRRAFLARGGHGDPYLSYALHQLHAPMLPACGDLAAALAGGCQR